MRCTEGREDWVMSLCAKGAPGQCKCQGKSPSEAHTSRQPPGEPQLHHLSAFPRGISTARHQPCQLRGEVPARLGAASCRPAPCGSVNVPTVSRLQAPPLHGAPSLSWWGGCFLSSSFLSLGGRVCSLQPLLCIPQGSLYLGQVVMITCQSEESSVTS